MSRRVLALLLAAAALGFADDLKKQRPQPPTSTKEEVPPEEDESLTVKQYSFNPLQAQKELNVGLYYFHKGSYRGAALRFREATKWNPGFAEAWLRLGETAEKQKDTQVIKEAYSKYLELEPNARNAAEIRKKLKKLK
jgi:tetratricopeptide (TPR) repeat protein